MQRQARKIYKTIASIFLLFTVCLFLCACANGEAATAPKEIYRTLEKKYGTFPYGMYYETDAKEWESTYFSKETIRGLFGDEGTFFEMVQEGCFYMSGAPTYHEEVAVFLCYSTDGALQMAGKLSERAKKLSMLEKGEGQSLTCQLLCRGRTVLYCRLMDEGRVLSAIDKLDF